jgi:hypothetical protein
MIGTDRTGVQYKFKGTVDVVERYTWNYEGMPKSETVLEKNFGAASGTLPIPRVPPITVGLVPGVRQNISGNGSVTPSLNLDFEMKTVKIFDGVKLSFEARKSGS